MTFVFALVALLGLSTGRATFHFCYPMWHRPGGDMVSEAPTPEELVAGAKLIIVGVPTDTARIVSRTRSDAFLPSTYLSFKVLQVLKGSLKDSAIVLAGELVPHDEYNSRAVPYRWARRSALRGSCVTYEYSRGAPYLLMLSEGPDGSLGVWEPLMPVNEQLKGLTDPWLLWVRNELARVSNTR